MDSWLGPRQRTLLIHVARVRAKRAARKLLANKYLDGQGFAWPRSPGNCLLQSVSGPNRLFGPMNLDGELEDEDE